MDPLTLSALIGAGGTIASGLIGANAAEDAAKMAAEGNMDALKYMEGKNSESLLFNLLMNSPQLALGGDARQMYAGLLGMDVEGALGDFDYQPLINQTARNYRDKHELKVGEVRGQANKWVKLDNKINELERKGKTDSDKYRQLVQDRELYGFSKDLWDYWNSGEREGGRPGDALPGDIRRLRMKDGKFTWETESDESRGIRSLMKGILPGDSVTNGDAAGSLGDQIRNTPGFDFLLQEGTDSILGNSAALGLTKSGATATDLGQYATEGVAFPFFQDYMNRLGGMAGDANLVSQNIGSSPAGQGAEGAPYISNAANDRASGELGQAGNWMSMINGLSTVAGDVLGGFNQDWSRPNQPRLDTAPDGYTYYGAGK